MKTIMVGIKDSIRMSDSKLDKAEQRIKELEHIYKDITKNAWSKAKCEYK